MDKFYSVLYFLHEKLNGRNQSDISDQFITSWTQRLGKIFTRIRTRIF